jgi:hypothetical protein
MGGQPDRVSRTPPTAFDRWVQSELMSAYEDALREPVPDELLRLINAPSQGHG